MVGKPPETVLREGNRLVFRGQLRHLTPKEVLDHLTEVGDLDLVHLDFSDVELAFPIAMLPLVAISDRLKAHSTQLEITWPKGHDIGRLFWKQGWRALLSGEAPPSLDGDRIRVPPALRYSDAKSQTRLVTLLTEVFMSNMRAPESVIHGLEWSLNEITDNVLNHADTDLGGVVQIGLRPTNGQIEFLVVDSGQGILKSLRASHDVVTDRDAIEEAVKRGVTSGAGQGNGLAGTIRIAVRSGGLVRITSGDAQLYLHSDANGNPEQRNYFWPRFNGTIVQAIIGTDPDFSLEEALIFEGRSISSGFGLIDAKYRGEKEFVVHLAEETSGIGSRESGRALRTKVGNLLAADSSQSIRVDWSGIPVVASSFADEFLGKLCAELGADEFERRVANDNMEQLVKELVDQAVRQRLEMSDPSS